VLVLAGFSGFLFYRTNRSETPGESLTSEDKTNNSNNAVNAGGILFRTPVAVTPIPITMLVLKPNALTLWSLYVRERYNRTGNPSDNGHVMYVLDIPSEVFCDLGSDSYHWLPPRYQSWILSCKTLDKTDKIAFVINGTAAEGITGGIYYDTTDPLEVHGMGDWPEFCYVVDIPSPVTPISSDPQEPNNTPTPIGTSSSQREK
jgi:hypothetical protein